MVEAGSAISLNDELYSMVLSRSFLDSLSTGYLLFNADGEIIDCNSAAVEWLGTERNQILGREWYELKSGAVRENGSPFPHDEQPSMASLRSGEPSGDVMIGVDSPGQARRWLLVRTYPLILEGQMKGVISSFSDVSDRVRRDRTRRVLLEINQFVMSGIDDEDPLQYLCDTLMTYGPYAFVGVTLASSTNESGYDFVCGAADNDQLYEAMAASPGLSVNRFGSIGTALRSNATQVLNDLKSHPPSLPLGELALQFGLGSVLAIPLTPGDAQAALAIFGRDGFSFDEITVLELETIAKEFEFGISHLRSVAELAASLEGTFGVLAEIIDARDPYTAGHQIHVGYLGEAIATHLGLDAAVIHLVRQSGEVHDIGKIAIPAEYLTRPGGLSALEFEVIKTHVTVGFNILSKASLPWPIAEVALQHHERLDGSGYPSGLLADEISLPARIIAVADVVEAMTHHRPYRPALGIEAALADVRQGAGVLYDAAVVEACLAVFEAGFSFDSRSDPRSEIIAAM